ncbi:MAG: DMT family transporter [Rhodocyclales bacterium]|nr:DMT family transporter [Rhodocyclales bacterium]
MFFLYPLLAVLIWSANTVVSKAAAGVVDPAAISLYRWLLAAAVLTPLFLRPLWRARREILPQLPRFAVLSLLGMVAYQCLAYYAAHRTSATNMGVICALVPLLGLLFNGLVFRARLSPFVVLGVALSLAGVLYLLGAGNPASLLGNGINLGDALMLSGAACYALYGILYKRWSPPFGQWLNLYVQALLAVVLLTPLATTAETLAVPARGIPLVLFAGLGSSILASYFWMRGLQQLGSERTAVFMNLLPLFTALIASVTLGERIYAYHWLGGGMILLGVTLSQRRPAARLQPA